MEEKQNGGETSEEKKRKNSRDKSFGIVSITRHTAQFYSDEDVNVVEKFRKKRIRQNKIKWNKEES